MVDFDERDLVRHAEDAGPIEHLRPLVESGTGSERRAVACLTAVKG